MTWGQGTEGGTAPRPLHPIARPQIDSRRTPFERTIAFQRYGLRLAVAALGEDHYAKALIVEQGFAGLPHVVSKRELDEYVQRGEVELFRGVSSRKYASQLRSGELYVGHGKLGGGIYVAGGTDARNHAAEFAQDPGSVIMRMAVKHGARIADVDELVHRMLTERQRAGGRRGSAWAATWVKTEVVSLYAVYMGYDGVVERDTGVWLMLNRTALRIQDRDLQP